MKLLDFMMHRRSIRKYQEKQIDKADLEKILQAGLYAPNAGGGQRSILCAIHNKALAQKLGRQNLKRFRRNTLIGSYVSQEQPSSIDDPAIKNGFYDAPTVCAIFTPKNFLYGIPDAFCCAENMVLEAAALGIGSCIVARAEETFDSPLGADLMQKWGIPENYVAQCFVCLGYCDGDYPTKKPRKSGRIIMEELIIMDAQTCLKKLELIGVLAFATTDENGCPQIRNISAIHYEKDALYFFTARGKSFCKELLRDGRVQVLGYTKFKEMIRLSAKAKPVADAEQAKWIDTIFTEQPYLANVYPDNTREIGIIFKIENAQIEYFNLGVNPIFRETYTIGAVKPTWKGYVISESCISCGTCQNACPQKCISVGTPYKINQNHCLHCGSCYEKCPVQAIKRL